MRTIFVIGGAEPDGSPWVLNLDGYDSELAARRAISWQRHGQGQYHPPGYWAIADLRDGQFVDRETGAVYQPTRRPYTIEAWASFIESIRS